MFIVLLICFSIETLESNFYSMILYMLVLTPNINNSNNNNNNNFYEHTCHCDPLVSSQKDSGASEGSFWAQQRGRWGDDLLTMFLGARNPTPVFFPENTSMQRHSIDIQHVQVLFAYMHIHTYIHTIIQWTLWSGDLTQCGGSLTLNYSI